MPDCPFCSPPHYPLAESRLSIAFLDTRPTTIGEVIIASKIHHDDLHIAPAKVASDLFLLAKDLATALRKAYRYDSLTLLQENGSSQTIPHLHLRLFGAFEEAQDRRRWTDIEFSREEPDLALVAQKIKKALDSEESIL